MFTYYIVRYLTIIMELYHVWMERVEGEVVKDEIFENFKYSYLMAGANEKKRIIIIKKRKIVLGLLGNQMEMQSDKFKTMG